MATTSTPAWSAPRSGLPGDAGAVDASAQLNQLLGTHAGTVIYQGNAILTPFGQNFSAPWILELRAYQYDQPFTMSGTTIGRVVIPLLPIGNSADVIVGLCADNAGTPGTIITRTRVPAAWITQVAAVYGTPTATTGVYTVQYTGSPLALAQYNSIHTASPAVNNWPYPTTGTGLSNFSDVSCYYGNYILVLGGETSGTAQSGVYTISCDGAGNLGQAIPQQSLPSTQDGTGAATVTIDPSSSDATLVITGGATTFGGPATSTVYTASFDPNAGAIASWSTQASLPFNANNHAMASYGGYVYATGGSVTTATAYAQVSNGQITAWNTGSPLPAGRPNAYMVAANGFVFVIGGFPGSAQSSVYFAVINSDGSLGPWMNGPSTPVALYASDSTVAVTTGGFGIVVNNAGNLYTLAVGPNGPDIGWLGFDTGQVGVAMGAVNAGPGVWQYYGVNTTDYDTFELIIAPRISVPLPAAGLTSGSTYHIVIDQVGEDPNNFNAFTGDLDAFPGNPTFLYRAKIGGSAWLVDAANYAIPIQIYDGSATGPVWHTREDAGARITTLANATTPDGRLLGILEATAQPAPALNMNPTFTSGTAPWTAAGGTLAQSSAQTRAGLPCSALVTPSGSAAVAQIASELIQVYQFHAYTASVWLYSPTGYADCAINIDWYNAAETLLSTTSGTVSAIAANTWTEFVLAGASVTPPAAAAWAQILPTESGTPSAANVFYASSATLQDQSAPMYPAVTQILYDGTWPSSGAWPPTGSVQLI